MTTPMTPEQLDLAARLATQLRVDSIRCSTQAGSGHPTSLSVLGTPVKVGSVGFFRCLSSFRPHVPCGGGPQSGSRWSARSAARTNDLEADEDPPHTPGVGRTR